MTLLVPGMAFAQGTKGTPGDTLTQEQKDQSTTASQPATDLLPDILKNTGLCVTPEEKLKYSATVLETPIDSPEDTVSYDTGNRGGVKGVINNGDGTMTKRCARFTQILNLAVSGSSTQQKTDQYLIKECPPESDIHDGYGQQANGNYYDCQGVTVIMSPLEQGGIGVINVYVSLIYRWVAGIVGVIAVLIMIVSGIQIITAQGESEAISAGKKRIMQSIGGIALLFFASGILYIINPTFFKAPDYTAPASTAPVTPPAD